MKKKLILLVTSLFSGIIAIICIIIAILMIFDFFGSNASDGYVESNEEYASIYKETLNKNIKYGNGYVPLERILYFYNALGEDANFNSIYTDNLDKETKRQKDLSDVCLLDKYKKLEVCSEEEIEESNLLGEEQSKPFSPPLKISNMNITSFFMEERTVFGTFSIHQAWDLSSPNETPVYSVCDGTVINVSFPYTENKKDINGGGGNQIKIKCEIDEETTYEVIYAHLYPNSFIVKEGEQIEHQQQIASVGTTGYSTGPHLHFQVMQNGLTIDGMSLIDFTYENDKRIDVPELLNNDNLDNGYFNGYNKP